MPIDPNSIKEIKFKNEDAVLRAYAGGASIRDAAVMCGVSSKTAHKIRMKHAHLFPKKENVFRTPKLPKKPAGIKRWVTVPVEIDEKICMAARAESRTWQEQVNFIFKGWGDGK
jgi:hypothetical protein